MHSYRYSDTRKCWEVYFDCGAQEFNPPILRIFDSEISAAMFAHYMNGGSVPSVAALME